MSVAERLRKEMLENKIQLTLKAVDRRLNSSIYSLFYLVQNMRLVAIKNKLVMI